jgi:catechol 2,3-dioxygenase-like lactoylglutathione lyase family enzyme
MSVTRIIPSIRSTNLEETTQFYTGILGLELGMEMLEDHFLMFNSDTAPNAQLIVNDNGHKGLPPGFAVDVGSSSRVTETHTTIQRLGFVVVEPLWDTAWGVRRFSLIDPNGVCVTVIGYLEPVE